MSRAQANKALLQSIPFDIPGVTPTTKLADLTVEQFIQLCVQLNHGLVISSRAPATPDQMERVIQSIRKLNIVRASSHPIDQIVQETQEAILKGLSKGRAKAANKTVKKR
jgi:hypothetical protein